MSGSPSSALYVSYDDVQDYAQGDLVPFVYNKLTSARTMASMDLALLETCATSTATTSTTTSSTTSNNKNNKDNTGRWATAVQALHGDVYRAGPTYEIRMLQDAYCQQLCVLDLNGPVQHVWSQAIRDAYHYNVEIDGMPVAVRQEDDYRITTRYWGGSPLGQVGGSPTRQYQFEETTDKDVYVHNHWNIEVVYKPSETNDNDNKDDNDDKDNDDKDKKNRYQIIRTTVQPYSVRHQFRDAATGVDIFNPIASCIDPADAGNFFDIPHTDYTMVADRSPQKAVGKVLFTYDVIWREYDGKVKRAAQKRWNIFLTLDGAIPLRYQFLSLVLSILINVALWGTLIFWVLRDLSYKPVFAPGNDAEQDQELSEAEKSEVALWPLSERVFRAPRKAPYFLTVLCGTGMHVLVASVIFLILFRLGIINQSLGERMITPVVIIVMTTAPVGGYVTGRMARMFGATIWLSLVLSFLTALLYPLLAMITIGFCYDVFPGPEAPQYQALSKSLPIILCWIWIMIPMTVGGGYFGYRAGSLAAFPITANMDTADNLEIVVQEDVPSDSWIGYGFQCWKVCRTPLLFILGGVLPVLCGFAAFSYGVAGPIFLGYYSSTKLATLAPFVLFLACSAGVAVLLQYRQLRIQQHAWWWAAFVTGSSSGLHIWLLALSWLFFNVSAGDVSAGTFATHLFWFAFIGIGVACLCGSVSVGACLIFHIVLHHLVTTKSERQPMLDDHDHDDEEGFDDKGSWEDHRAPIDDNVLEDEE